MIRNITLIAMAGLAMLFSSALAQNNQLQSGADQNGVFDGKRSLADFSVENLIPVLNEMGIPWEGRVDQNGNNLIVATNPDGLNFVLQPNCQSQNANCIGLAIIAIFSDNADQKTVNAFNYRYAFLSAGTIPESGVAYLNRYLVADYGFPKGNLIVNLNVFFQIAGMFEESVNSATTTVSTTVSADDLAANYLNRQQAVGAGLDVHGNSLSEDHLSQQEKNMEFVKVLLKAEEQDPGKIMNFVKPAKKD